MNNQLHNYINNKIQKLNLNLLESQMDLESENHNETRLILQGRSQLLYEIIKDLRNDLNNLNSNTSIIL